MKRRQLLTGLAAAGALMLPAIDPLVANAMNAAASTTNLKWWVRTSLEGVPSDFKSFWETRGGLAIFGWPISTEGQQQLEDGQTYTVMYFERGRLERHSYGVELGQFGRHILTEVLGGVNPGNCAGNAGSPDAQTQPGPAGWAFSLPSHPNQESMAKLTTKQATPNTWYHRVWKPAWFMAPRWDGCDPFCLGYAKNHQENGEFIDWSTPGQIIFSQWRNTASWQLSIITDPGPNNEWIKQFLDGAVGPIEVTVRTVPGSPVALVGPDGRVRDWRKASDGGDVTIELPLNCRITIAGCNKIHDEFFNTIIYFGPRGRTYDVNFMNGNLHQWG